VQERELDVKRNMISNTFKTEQMETGLFTAEPFFFSYDDVSPRQEYK